MDIRKTPYGRRIRFILIVLASQFLLLALALGWGIYLFQIARYGGVYSVENNYWLLYAEIFATVLIVFFAIIVIFLEFGRMNARRQGDTEKKREYQLSTIVGRSTDGGKLRKAKDSLSRYSTIKKR